MDDSTWQLYRSAGTLMVFPASLSEPERQDILDSLLLAQLVANKQHDPYQASSQWRRNWAHTMDLLHWTVTASTGQEEPQEQPFTLASLLAHTLGALPGPTPATLLADLGTTHVKALEAYCIRRHAESTQLKLSFGLARNAWLIHLASIAFETAAPLDEHWLSHTHQDNGHRALTVTRTCTTLTLASDYAAERSKVITSLGSRRSREIERIPLTTQS
ncbi:MAG TPA: hypothetical protein VJS90_02215 [Pseudomonas sp.]|uniref:hypothetical protein n=1 Tax=Pseudomonas sp. TaxID=306 RepID=UPI002B4A0878|nr:hypothetical protein [Pseudomonas sp.]HKS11831.1 hypothetical protein [Pseudomonas sp.]